MFRQISRRSGSLVWPLLFVGTVIIGIVYLAFTSETRTHDRCDRLGGKLYTAGRTELCLFGDGRVVTGYYQHRQ